ncbi:MAG: diguanylate cyclase [Lysobacterales bacterium]
MQENLEVKYKALMDLTLRARSGMLIYMIIWLVVSFWGHFPSEHALLFFGNFAILLLVAGIRFALNLRTNRCAASGMSESEVSRLTDLLEWMLVLGGLHWGLISAWLIHHPDHVGQRHVVVVVLAALAMGGTSILSISRVVRRWYPVGIYAPSAIGGLVIGGSENYVLLVLLVFSVIYIHTASQIAARDYYDAIKNEQLADARFLEVKELSTTDPLTQIRNRQYFDEQFLADWKSCERGQLPLSVLMIDLDHFKNLNDNYGHLFGDYCLQQVALTLRSCVRRSTDTLARYGGEEFIVLIPGTQEKDVFRLGESIVRKVAEMEVEYRETRVHLSCSVGVATIVPPRDLNPETLIEYADRALYKAKRFGRDRCESWEMA